MLRSILEQLEDLEQLRALSAGYTIQVGIIGQPILSINTAEDYRAFVARVRARQSQRNNSH